MLPCFTVGSQIIDTVVHLFLQDLRDRVVGVGILIPGNNYETEIRTKILRYLTTNGRIKNNVLLSTGSKFILI